MSTWQNRIGNNLIIKDSVGTIEEKHQGNTKIRIETDNQGLAIRINNHNSKAP